jgi:hypothetical protein
MTSAERLGLAAVLAIALAAPRAIAAPSAADLETARALVKDGRALRASGDLPGALEKFRAAHAVASTPITAIELARTYLALGKLLDAREVCLGVARIAVEPDETERGIEARDAASKLADELAPRIPSLVVRLHGPHQARPASLAIDGAPVSLAVLGEARKVDPGRHEVVLTLDDGARLRASIDVPESTTREVTLDEPSPPPPVSEPSSVPPSEDVGSRESAPRTRPNGVLFYSGLVVAGAGLSIGAIAGLSASSQSSSLKSACPADKCGPANYGELDDARNAARVSNVAFAIGGAGAAAFVLSFFVREQVKEAPRASIIPALGVGWVGAHGVF